MEDSATNVSVHQLVEAGAHFGHQKRRWNPKMKRFIFEARHGLYIIDLAKTLQQLRSAIAVVSKVVERGESILFVGTKKQAKGVIKESAELCGEFYVCERWLGGMLTNMSTIRQSIKTLEKTEKQIEMDDGVLTKKELLLLGKKQTKLNKNLSGIRSMRQKPGLLIIVDPGYENIAVAEARKLGIPIMALVDTNCDPDPIDYVIPCNDDSLKSIKIVVQALAQTIVQVKRANSIEITPPGVISSKGQKTDKHLKNLGKEEILNMKYSSNDEKEPS
ncbi:30S ribosomal protein S2 [Candidatus Clavichlamydia salmonicola]|uniref:30S ribosomal protein S2 n=1 Tax=Candidatus Clavichlamydia salmonicola TaxID=469812 RepID=UPI001891DE6F|nr:30S ribosomal protein S2 [Candidatus Clavichlamydia salmonicola]